MFLGNSHPARALLRVPCFSSFRERQHGKHFRSTCSNPRIRTSVFSKPMISIAFWPVSQLSPARRWLRSKRWAVDYGCIPPHGPYWFQDVILMSKILVPLGWAGVRLA